MTDNDDLRERAKVEQADRDAAAAYGANGVADHHFTSGAVDDHPLVITLARHRLTAIEALQQQVERLEERAQVRVHLLEAALNERASVSNDPKHWSNLAEREVRAALGDDVG